jgi:predicted nucleotidyltransferase
MNTFEQLKQKIISLASSDAEVDALWLYGSHAKGNAGPDSDIDLAIIFKSRIDDIFDRRLRPELLAIEWQALLTLPENGLSIVDMDNAPIPLAMGVLQTGKLLLNNNPTHEFNTSRRIMSKWELDYQYHYKTYG